MFKYVFFAYKYFYNHFAVSGRRHIEWSQASKVFAIIMVWYRLEYLAVTVG